MSISATDASNRMEQNRISRLEYSLQDWLGMLSRDVRPHPIMC